MLIALIGKSGAGKSTMQGRLAVNRFAKVVSYTTRQPKEGEIQGIDYHFISEEEFEKLYGQGFFVTDTEIYGNRYGVAKKDIAGNKVVVVEKNGLMQLKKLKNIELISFYLDVPVCTRVERLYKRGDRLSKIFRRIHDDYFEFDGIEKIVDHTVNNESRYNGYLTIIDIIKKFRQKKRLKKSFKLIKSDDLMPNI